MHRSLDTKDHRTGGSRPTREPVTARTRAACCAAARTQAVPSSCAAARTPRVASGARQAAVAADIAACPHCADGRRARHSKTTWPRHGRRRARGRAGRQRPPTSHLQCRACTCNSAAAVVVAVRSRGRSEAVLAAGGMRSEDVEGNLSVSVQRNLNVEGFSSDEVPRGSTDEVSRGAFRRFLQTRRALKRGENEANTV